MASDTVSRRDFLARAGLAAAGVALARTAPGTATPQAPSDRVGVGIIGLRNQGRLDGLNFLGTGQAEVVAVCDVDEAQLARVGDELAQHANQSHPPRREKDFRRLLEAPDIDAVIVATPDHWHAIPTVLACGAGKDVYVEKPLSWSIAEGRAMVHAARRHQRIVTVGTQQRSGAHFAEGLERVRSGKLGAVPFARAWITHRRADIGNPPDGPVPDGVDYDMWLGPAPERPFNPNRFHYQWHWYWDYGTGEMGNWGAHWLDVVRWGLGLELPDAVSASGGTFHFTDSRETPDTQMVLYRYPTCTVQWDQYLWSERSIEGRSSGAAFYGTEGTLVIDRGGWWHYGPDGKTLVEESGGSSLEAAHARNFLQCVKTRERPSADVEDGHKSAILCHLGNIALRLGREVRFDAETETFGRDREANRFLMRKPRKPWDGVLDLVL